MATLPLAPLPETPVTPVARAVTVDTVETLRRRAPVPVTDLPRDLPRLPHLPMWPLVAVGTAAADAPEEADGVDDSGNVSEPIARGDADCGFDSEDGGGGGSEQEYDT